MAVLLAVAVLLVAAAAEIGLRVVGGSRTRTAVVFPTPTPEFVVLCLGESSTAGLWVAADDAYPRQLERALGAVLGESRVRVVVPPDIGQNTSHLANRIRSYLQLYRPRLVVVMAGHNNEWSLGESHVFRFLPLVSPGPSVTRLLRARTVTLLEDLRLFRVARAFYMRGSGRWVPAVLSQNENYGWGDPEFTEFPPEPWILEFAAANRPAFTEMWRSDLRTIAREARQGGAAVLLMTYPIASAFPPVEESVRLAREEGVSLVRNDETFQAFRQDGRLDRYLFHDGWHPNEKGYAVVAGNVLREIQARDLLGLGARGGPLQAAAPPDPARYSAMPVDRRIEFGSTTVDRYLGAGWSRPEAGFRWTEGPRAEVIFSVAVTGPAELRLSLRPFLAPGQLDRQSITVRLNGTPVAEWTLERAEVRTIALTPSALRPENVLELELPGATSPARLGLSRDPRELAVAIEWLAVLRTP
jgi:lysophospholipase L1-like esterase